MSKRADVNRERQWNRKLRVDHQRRAQVEVEMEQMAKQYNRGRGMVYLRMLDMFGDMAQTRRAGE